MKKASHWIAVAALALSSATVADNAKGSERVIAHDELMDKLSGFWIGQLLGNYIGFPFENKYVEEPVPILVDRVYTAGYDGDPELMINSRDRRGHIPVLVSALRGAFSDDDTDIEFVTLHAVEKYGLDITYPEITKMWMTHINDYIWVANREARNLMDRGLIAPDTGRRQNNKHWFQIDPQLVNEIWSAFYPGMTKRAADRALWGARITNDDWGTHPTIAYGAMISAAFFESDVRKLVDIAVEAVPDEGPFAEGIRDVVKWHSEHDDWRETRQRIHDRYYAYKKGSYEAPVSVVSSLANGLTGVMAVLYGEGDYMKTVGIATSAGYDCDNQAATAGGLIGVLNGLSGMGEAAVEQTMSLPAFGRWDKPFNDQYVNISRDEIKLRTPISEIVERIAAVAKAAILENGGRMEVRDGKTVYVVNSDL
ncbi:MAG: ADP-ribosylglycohydrolase family protein [Bryobacterales bacterium]|nr:ADP-ribosylglycohydrolase family protein [Bryobacterales bacterium]